METKRGPDTDTSTSASLEIVSIAPSKYMLRNVSSSVKKYLKFDETGRKSKKRKRVSKTNEKMKNIINNIEKEIEEQLDLQTEENDFITTNVKAILKEIIMDEDIKEMVRKTLHPSENVACYEPKLTRAKVRELLTLRPDLSLPMLWPIPTKNTNFVSECLSLINEELSENSSEDEEYKPEDDDDKSEYADSLFPSECDNLGSERGLNDSFDLPDGAHDIGYIEPEIEENICHRTRSKLPLTETPLEVIEQSFIPPDITSDMYEPVLDKDHVWYKFLTGFQQPIDKLDLEHIDDDDDPEDPEYTIQANEETVDREELRKDKAVEVPSIEVQELIVELLRYCEPPYPNKKVLETNTNSENRSVGGTVEITIEPVNTVEEEPTTKNVSGLQKSDCPILTESQKLLVRQHIRQHVQLTLMHFLQCYKHPTLFVYANRMKTMLESLQTLAGFNRNSYFYASNLDSALKLITDWEQIRADDPMPTTILTQRGRKENNPDKFGVQLMKLVCKSNAFIYPLMLPEKPFCHKVTTNIHKRDMTEPEEWLLASGLQQFSEYALNTQRKKISSNPKWETMKLISQYLFSNQFTPSYLKQTVKRKSSENTNNSIKYYLKHNRAPPLKHYIIPVNLKPLCQQPLKLLPKIWRNYVKENFVIIVATSNPKVVHHRSSKNGNS